MSFEVKGDPEKFLKKLKLIKKAVSLGGVESTFSEPVKTSHAKLTAAERASVGISNKLLRLSVGIEEAEDLIGDIKQALWGRGEIQFNTEDIEECSTEERWVLVI